MSSTEKKHTQKEAKAKDVQGPVMLQVWLNEPEDIMSGADVWSSERAVIRPRRDIGTTKQPKKKSGDAAKSA
ncbi:hypothetical protein F53441_10612 [Fusarium austroafricanum]|uniref:Uncharacterized protein n=1 Tax=Fusarium austroafricanum TaxID=2364996 RepID=A0A8H4KAC0_9HYPO|nr:hypothetical protein F53441_10612 [Fusarium austroafricanum]